jgi:hypothetical protein
MGLRDLEGRWDDLPPAQAVARAWRDPGNPKVWGTWHRWARRDVADLMPLLARSLDRLLAEMAAADLLPSTDDRLWEDAIVTAVTACSAIACRCGHPRTRHRGGTGYCRARDCRCSAVRCACGGRRDCAA